MNAWTIQSMLHWMTDYFKKKNLPSARLDAELLLSKVMRLKRIDLYLKFEQMLTTKELAEIKGLVQRRGQNEPVAYILENQEFYGRNMSVGPGCLIPRPETEQLVDEAIAFLKTFKNKLNYLDVATGSGCIASTIYLEAIKMGVEIEATAVDISQEALQYAERNFKNLLDISQSIKVVKDDFEVWSQTCDMQFDLITCNPPYIADSKPLMVDVKNFEPHVALFGGALGHEKIKTWFPKMVKILKPGGLILCEIGYDQKISVQKAIEELMINSNFNFELLKDYSGHDRIAKVW